MNENVKSCFHCRFLGTVSCPNGVKTFMPVTYLRHTVCQVFNGVFMSHAKKRRK
jgi:hypothetical protein